MICIFNAASPLSASHFLNKEKGKDVSFPQLAILNRFHNTLLIVFSCLLFFFFFPETYDPTKVEKV